MSHVSSVCNFGWKAPNFLLKGVDGKNHSLSELKGTHGTLIFFICQHCPYVKAILNNLIRDTAELRTYGIQSIAINSNDAEHYPEDDFNHMVEISKTDRFSFPYLWDEDQSIAKRYDALCTPDFFGFNKNLELQYRGRLDETKTIVVPNARRELFEAMVQISETDVGPHLQTASMGCSIKWKTS